MSSRTGHAARIRYLPALDGLRAIALLSVLAFHGGVDWISGGYLPLTSFFVLSGFLITALLLAERARNGRTDLRAFWGRRIRRLAPGALLGLVLVAAYLRFGADNPSSGVRGDALASVFWVTNWRFIFDGQVYADAFSDPSPLQHYWSLAVEEQFYLALPLLFVGLLALGRGRRWLFAGVVTGLGAASVVWMAYLHSPGDPPLRVYFGTDTRAAELLVGVLLAVVLVDRSGRIRTFGGSARRAANALGAVALALSVASWVLVKEYDDRLYDGGLILIALLAAVVVTAATQPDTVVDRALRTRPLVWLGQRSYGIYIFHWPLFLWLDEQRTGLASGPLLLVRLALTIALATLSLRLIETPIRRGEIPVRIGVVGWANATVAVVAVMALVTASLTPTVSLASGAQAGDIPPPPPTTTTTRPAPSTTQPTTTSTTVAHTSSTTVAPREPIAPASAPPPTEASTTTTTTTAPPPPLRVMVAGDSLARNLATGLQAWQDAGAPIELYDTSIVGCPLARGGARHPETGGVWPVPENCGWWATEALDERLRGFRPDVILMNSVHNELTDRSHPSWIGVRSPGDPVFDRFVVDEWIAAAKRFASTGATLAWTNGACTEMGLYDERLDTAEAMRRVDHVNAHYIPQVEGSTSAQIIDLDGQLCPTGFSDTVFGVANARPDGIHLSDEAALVLAERWLGPLLLEIAGRTSR